MRGPSIIALDLSYGCHRRRYELAGGPAPVVIAGPNGSGKTTLLEAIPRTVFGFRRRREQERNTLAARVPWSGSVPEATVELVTDDGRRLSVHRDFSGDHVEVRSLDEDRLLFSGEANPASDSPSAVMYRGLLLDLFGLDDGDTYRRTAWIGQGELLATDLDSGLLRAASGSQALVHVAAQDVAKAHEQLTAMPIVPGQRRRRTKDRELELATREAERCTEGLARAREAEEERLTLVRSRTRLEAELAELGVQIAALEEALGPLTESRALEAELEAERGTLRRLENAERELREARERLRRAEDAWKDVSATSLYPEDFEQRVGRLEVLWARRKELEGDRPRAVDERGPDLPSTRFWLVGTGAAVCWIGGGIMLAAGSAIGWALVAPGLVLTGWAWLERHRRDRRLRRAQRSETVRASLAELDDRIRAASEGIPDGDSLSPETLPDRRFRVDAQRRAGHTRDRSRAHLESVVAQVVRTLAVEGSEYPGADARSGAEDAPENDETSGEVERQAGFLLDHVERARLQSLERVAARLLRVEGSGAIAGELPDGVEASLPGVDRARRERRAEREKLETELRDVLVRLARAEEDRVDLASLEEARSAHLVRVRQLEAEVRVHELAHGLLQDGYEEFRARDQERLLSAVSSQLEALSGGGLGPVEAEESLVDARVGCGGRMLPLTSPPLSFGEQHLVLLAIRLGAADFLAEESVRHPLLVDEPFAHLDEDRARAAWETLRRVAETRQVILTTQDRLVLDHLRIQADLDLSA